MLAGWGSPFRQNGGMPDTQAVVFDFYNTLAAPHADDFWSRLPGLVAAAGGEMEGRALEDWERLQPEEHLEHSTSEAAYRAWQARRLEALLEQCGVPRAAHAGIVAEIEDVRYTRLFQVFPDVADVLADLRDRGLMVGICSNWDWDLERHLRHNRIHDLIDFFVCSAIHGHRKPHPAIFATVIDQAGVPAERIVFVGDSLSDDIAGSMRAGLRPVHIARHHACPPDGHDGVACLPDLHGLAALIA